MRRPTQPTTSPHEGVGFSRRALVSTAAWSVPAVSLALAAPAFANSTDLQFVWGPNPVVPSPEVPLVWDLSLAGGLITAPAALAAPSAVTVMVTFAPNTTSQHMGATVYTFAPPYGWISDRAPEMEVASVTFTSLAPLSSGQSIAFSGLIAGTAADNQFGIYTLTVTVGSHSKSFTIATPPAFPA